MRAMCSVSMVFLSGAAMAQVPTMMNYQGFLTDPGGAPLSGAYDLTFRIHDSVTAGAELWSEAHAGVLVSEGLFSVLLGGTNPLDPSVFVGEAWLELEMGGETMTPRVRVVSVGYSFVAAVAQSIPAGTNLDVGDVSVGGSVTYATPKTRHLTISHSAFTPYTSDTEFWNRLIQGLNATAVTGGGFQAPVLLPDGAVITEIGMQAYDNTPGVLTLSLYRFACGTSRAQTVMATIPTSVDSASWQYISETSIVEPVVDNANYCYTLYAALEVGTVDMRLSSVRITYTVTEPLP